MKPRTNNATVELTKEVLDTYLVYNWIGFRNIGQMKGTIYLEFPKCLGLPDGMVFEMLTFMEGFQLSNSAFDARLNTGLLAHGFRVCPNDSQLDCY